MRGLVISKTGRIHAASAAGNRIGALRIAARVFDRSHVTKIFKRGMDAYNNPAFYRQLGKDPDRIVAAALQTLAGNSSTLGAPPSIIWAAAKPHRW